MVLDGPHDKDDALLEEPRVDVISPLAARRLLDDHGNEIQCGCAHTFACCDSEVPIFSRFRAFRYANVTVSRS